MRARCGVIFTTVLLLHCASAARPPPVARRQSGTCQPLRAVLIVPGSSSVSAADWTSIKAFSEQMISSFAVGNATYQSKLGYVRDTGEAMMSISDDERVLKIATSRMAAPSGTSSLANSLTTAVQLMGNTSVENNVDADRGIYGTVIIVGSDTTPTSDVTATLAIKNKYPGYTYYIISVGSRNGTNSSLYPLSSTVSSISLNNTDKNDTSPPYITVSDYSQLTTLDTEMGSLKRDCDRNCTINVNTALRWFDQCACGCDKQSNVLQIYVFIMVCIATLRTCRASVEAIKLVVANEDTPRSSSPSWRGKREHLITFCTLGLLVLSAFFFTGECPSHWTETPMLATAGTIIALMAIPPLFTFIQDPVGSVTDCRNLQLVMHALLCCDFAGSSPTESASQKSSPVKEEDLKETKT